jgi:hypothetical protein
MVAWSSRPRKRVRRAMVGHNRRMAKTACPVTRTQFTEKAEALKVVINGTELLADVKEFSTGSFGWYLNGKIVVTVDGKPLSVQVGMNLTVVGSKEAEKGG